MKKQWNGFLAGVLVTIMALGIGTTALAAYQKQATLNYSGIKITLNGQSATPKDANGNVVEPFTIDGTTYLPVRGIAGVLGLDVQWEQETQTVKISNKTPEVPASSEAIVLSNGNYIAGTDFPTGTYDVIAISGSGTVMSDNFLDGGINAMMGAEDDEYSDYYSKEYKNIRFQDGVELKIVGSMGALTVRLVPKQ